jgi:prepilin-type N-terminal cleavage/methylation domain-containing protein
MGRRTADERGFTLVEVLVAILLLVVGALGVLVSLSSSGHLTLTAQREQAAMTAAEQTMEQLRAMTYTSLALSSLPTHSADGNGAGDTSGNPANPNYWVSASNLLIPASFNSETSSTLSGVSSTGEPLLSGGTVSPGPSTVTSNGYSASIYRYVTSVNDRCSLLGVDLCPGTQDAKRVTVAVVLNGGVSVGVLKPVWLSTVIANPQAGVGG